MTDPVQARLRAAETALQAARALLNQEIAGYPAPIAGCDAQFNHLLAQRQRVAKALGALRRDIFVPTPRTPDRLAGIESR